MVVKRWLMLSISAVMLLLLSACGGEQAEAPEAPDSQDSSDEETATEEETTEEETVTLVDSDEQEVAMATLTEDEAGVHISLEGENLPSGEHGFHIHNQGACEAPDFESSGEHYNPTDANHGFDDPDGPHAGDLENIEVADDGTVSEEMTNDMVTLEEGADNTLKTDEGTAFIIHSGPDDYETQPSGDSGDPIACGVISE